MSQNIVYRHWQPGDDAKVAPFALSEDLVPNEEYYQNKFKIHPQLEPEGIWLAVEDEQIVGHALGRPWPCYLNGRLQRFGLVEMVAVAMERRRQGIGSQLVKQLLAYFESIECRGSLLSTDNEPAYRMYQKLGYHQLTAKAEALVTPSQGDPTLGWTPVNLSDLETLQSIREQWAKRCFPVLWGIDDVHRFNLRGYRVLCRREKIIGYAQWIEPSNRFPWGKVADPVVPSETPDVIIESVRTAISMPIVWRTCLGSRYEQPLRSLGCTLESYLQVIMFHPLGVPIELEQVDLAFTLG